jgi:hypothetical protein
MKSLDFNWITDGWNDSEYKQYLFLSYLQEVEKSFKGTKLYPPLAELIEHHKEMSKIRQNTDNLSNGFKKDIASIDLSNAKIKFDESPWNDNIVNYVREMLDFAIPKLECSIEQGKEIYEFIESNLQLEQVGLSPIYQKEGYLFLEMADSHNIEIYRYTLSLIENVSARYQALKMEHLSQERKSIHSSFEQMKLKLIQTFKDLPNPATFLVRSKLQVPLHETLVPISKRILLKQLVQI